jgi:hypothetical protein
LHLKNQDYPYGCTFLVAPKIKNGRRFPQNPKLQEIQQCNQSNCKVVIAHWNMASRQSNKTRTDADRYIDEVKTLIGID